MLEQIDIHSVIQELSLDVRNFKKTGNETWNWSCEVCGDSTTNRHKARFGVARKDGSYVCHCFNCDYAASLNQYLKDHHSSLYQKYVFRATQIKASESVSMYDLNILFNGDVSNYVLEKLFYIDKFPGAKEWISHLKKLKIKLSDKNIANLFAMHREKYKKPPIDFKNTK